VANTKGSWTDGYNNGWSYTYDDGMEGEKKAKTDGMDRWGAKK
jgi:hypothetical protein